jgi:hypothetical protein
LDNAKKIIELEQAKIREEGEDETVGGRIRAWKKTQKSFEQQVREQLSRDMYQLTGDIAQSSIR